VIRDNETVDVVGSNAKMNEFCAIMVRYIDGEIAKRKKVEGKNMNKSGTKIESLDEIKKIELDIMISFDRFYKEHDI
jgi:hypothetical protein